MKCYRSTSNALKHKNVKFTIICKDINMNFSNLNELHKLVTNIIGTSRLITTSLMDNIEFMENELIGDKYIVYKYRIYLKHRKAYIGVRVITKNNTIISTVFTIGKEVPNDVLNANNLNRYQVYTLSRIESPTPLSYEVPGQRDSPNFIIYRILGQPIVDIQSWRLIIDGLVKKKLVYTYDELMNMRQVD